MHFLHQTCSRVPSVRLDPLAAAKRLPQSLYLSSHPPHTHRAYACVQDADICNAHFQKRSHVLAPLQFYVCDVTVCVMPCTSGWGSVVCKASSKSAEHVRHWWDEQAFSTCYRRYYIVIQQVNCLETFWLPACSITTTKKDTEGNTSRLTLRATALHSDCIGSTSPVHLSLNPQNYACNNTASCPALCIHTSTRASGAQTQRVTARMHVH